jgi:hypothetical protein
MTETDDLTISESDDSEFGTVRNASIDSIIDISLLRQSTQMYETKIEQ